MASTTRKATLLALLTLQVGVQPLLMGWYASDARDVRLRVGVVEALKLLLALGSLSFARGSDGLWAQLKGWRLRAALATTVLPALIYVLQNLLNHAAVVALDGVTFNVLNQTKIIWTALLVYLLLGKRQSPLQLLALVLLCAAAVLMTTSSPPHVEDSHDSMGPDEESEENDAAFFTGAYQALLGAVLSALAGSIIQRALQREKRNQYMVTVELSVLGQASLLLLAVVQSGLQHATSDTSDDSPASLGPSAATSDMWAGWSSWTLLALLCQALGGVLVGFVIRDCGNVEKSFAVVGGMGLTAALETHFNGKPFGRQALAAMLLVAISTGLYTLNPPTEPEKLKTLPVITRQSVSPARVGAHSAATATETTSRGSGVCKKKSSVDAGDLEPFLTVPAADAASSASGSGHISSNSCRDERRRTTRQLQSLPELAGDERRELETVV